MPKKIDKLTPEQEKAMEAMAVEWEQRVLGGDDSMSQSATREGIDFIYSLSKLPPPEIIFCGSPMDMAFQAGLKKGETFDWLGMGYDAGWTAFYEFMQNIGVKYSKEIGFDKWLSFMKNSGVFATILYERGAFVCPRPVKVYRNSAGDLHKDGAKAIEWRDGYGEYFLNGVSVPEALAMTPAEQLDPALLLKEKNVEVRREFVRKVGMERIVTKLGAKVLDTEGDYELLLLDLKDGRKREYLKMKNPSIGVMHVEGVPPGTKTVAEALRFRNGVDTPPLKLT